ncbi:hypothetical protein BGW80DRAFT_1565389 [Lactifluus volemus]|nr:hypothetical protein BGW80DRAFT_1565389 [Lactifluus volemus]
MHSVKQGSGAVGLRLKTHAILVSLKYQQKMFHIDDHVGIAIAGLTLDARVLLPSFYISPTDPNDLISKCSNFMRQQAMASTIVFNQPVPLEDLIHPWLRALHETLQQDKELITNNTSIGVLGPCSIHEAEGTPVDFRILERGV